LLVNLTASFLFFLSLVRKERLFPQVDLEKMCSGKQLIILMQDYHSHRFLLQNLLWQKRLEGLIPTALFHELMEKQEENALSLLCSRGPIN
jgi:hypothetical protein